MGLISLAVVPRAARAASVSPSVVRAVRGTPAEADIARGVDLLNRAKQRGVDRVPARFALDMAKYPRGGVAHRNVLVVLAKFPADGSSPAQGPAGNSTPFYYQKRLFSDDPNDGLISMREFYAENSKGRLVISGRVTSDWLSMPHSYGYYAAGASGFGVYPRNAQGLAEDAMNAALDDFEGDLRYFDNDGPDGVPSSGDDDGYIDAVLVIAPGQGGEVAPTCCDRLWAHQFTLAIYSNCPSGSSGAGCLPGMQLGDVRGYVYVLGSEFNDFPGDNAVGTYFHEFGHTLGLPDLYDPDPGRGGLGFYSLMSLGNYLPFDGNANTAGGPLGSRPGNLDAWSRQFLGFDDPLTPSTAGSWSLPPVTRGGGSLRLWTDGEPGTEYFLVENRVREGSDRFVPGAGLLVYHVDDTQVDNLGGPSNYRVTLVEADGAYDMTSSSNYGEPEDFFPGPLLKRTLTEATSPNSRSFAGLDTGIRITNMVGAADNADTASFDLVLSTEPELRLAGFTVDDGGGDNQPDPNEAITLTMTVRNTGLASGPIHLTLGTADGAVTMTDGQADGAAMAPGSTQTLAQTFQFSIGTVASQPHDIPFTVTWTEDGGGTGSFSFPLTVGIASGLAEDFESGAEPGLFWTHAALPGSTGDQWHSTNSRASSGTRSAKLGSTLALGSGPTNESETYDTYQDAALVSPRFDLPAGSELVFQSWIDAETNGGTGCWDGARVELSLNGGEWFPIDVDGGYGYQVEHNSEATLRGQLVFSGSPQRWRRVTADVSPYSGSARVRFRFSSDGADEPTDSFGRLVRRYEGWYVDDVAIQPRTASGPTPRKLSLRAGPSPYWAGGPSAGRVTIRFSAKDGLPHPELSPEVKIYDVRGRLVKSMIAKPYSLVASEFRATWDGRGRNGEPVRSGMYFIQVDIQGTSESFRLIVLH